MSKRIQNRERLSFKEAVTRTPDISTGFKEGLSAFGEYSKKIIIPDSISIEGSVDIDKETMLLYPQDNRWDYVFSCENNLYYIEVHSANTREVSTVVKKLQWLKQWLSNRAPELIKLTDYGKFPFFWVQSSNCQIPKHLPQYKKAVSHKIKPIREWNYDVIINNLGYGRQCK